MKRAVLLAALFVAACGDDGHGFLPDAGPPDDMTGSGSGAAMFGVDPSPPDVALEWMVLGLSAVVVGGSVRSRRRAKTKFDL